MLRQFRNGGPWETSVFYVYIRESWYFWMVKSKWEKDFHNYLVDKMVHVDGQKCSSELSTKTAKRFGWTCHKGRGCCYGLALWLFSNYFTSRWTSTLLLAMTMTFSPHTDNIKLTLVHSNRRWRKRGMNMIRRRWHLPFAGFLCWKSNQRKLSLSFSSAYFGYGFEIIFFVAYMLVILSLSWKLFMSLTLPCSKLFCFSVNSELFLPGFCRWSLRSDWATGVVLSLYQYSQLQSWTKVSGQNCTSGAFAHTPDTLIQLHLPNVASHKASTASYP